jgi:phytanoyl-CoA hydroxylase
MPELLTLDQLGYYERDGFLKVEKLISGAKVHELRTEIHRLAHNPPSGLILDYEAAFSTEPESQRLVRKIRNVGRHSSLVLNFCTSAPMTIVARDILGGPIGFYGDQALFKAAVGGSAKPLHQDAAYFRINPPTAVVTFWCSLDVADESNGCMHYIPGSHKQGIVDHSLIANTPHLVAGPQNGKLVAVPTSEGDCLVHNSVTFHMTPPNTSPRPRLALLAHYVRLDASFPPRSPNAVPIIRL